MNITVNTKGAKEVIDLTPMVESELEKAQNKSGICNIFVAHTTCAVTTMDLDPGTDEDFLDAIDKIFPKGNWRHPHDPSHVGDHIMSSLIGPSVSLPFKSKKLILGTWQRVVLVELSGPRARNIEITPL